MNRDVLQESFQAYWGCAPYRFQLELAACLLEGYNVILQAPTGAGKTWAALFPFLHAWANGLSFPRKCLYAVPMRVLARSFHDALAKNKQSGNLDVRLQTGEQQDDPKFEGSLIFATIDQILSSFLNIPYSLSKRQGNLNAGAVVSSYLVFDEFHLLDPGSTLPTTIEMLRMLKGITPFLLMTATFSGEMLKRLAALLDAQVITVSQEELQTIPSQKGKERRFHRVDALLTAEAVLAHHRTRSIAICNTVERAQALFEELRACVTPDVKVILLHSRFLQTDRRKKEDEVRHLFSKNGDRSGKAIVVATQVIEVGLDITCEVMHTELAPTSSILQRAGRCARFEGEKGDVYVHQVPLDRKGEPNYAPYLHEQATLCEKTWEALVSFDGENMNFAAEQDLVNQVHAEADGRMLDGLQQTSYAHRKEMERAIGQQELGLARSLIRNDDSVTVFTHSDPTKIENPYNLEGFSLFFGTLHGQFKEWQEAGLPNEEISWLLKYPQEKEAAEGEDRPVRYEWKPVEQSEKLKRSAIHVVNPTLVQYDPDMGFRFCFGRGFQSPLRQVQPPEEPGKQRTGYRLESYHEHVQKMLDFYQTRLSREITYAAAQLERQMGLESGSLDRAIRLAIALHDVGKMDRRWQGWAHEWQSRIGLPVPNDYMIAHTEYDPDNLQHLNLEAEISSPRPTHAAEGAVAVYRVIHQLLGSPGPSDPRFKLMKAIFTAIARHHSPSADSYKAFDLHPAARTTLDWALAELGVNEQTQSALITSKPSQPIGGLLVHPSNRDELLLYFLVVRALRLADQEAMEERGQDVSKDLLCR